MEWASAIEVPRSGGAELGVGPFISTSFLAGSGSERRIAARFCGGLHIGSNFRVSRKVILFGHRNLSIAVDSFSSKRTRAKV